MAVPSRVEIEHYSVAYFDRILRSKRSSAELTLRAGLIRARMSPAFNGNSALERFERSYAIEIRNRILFDFYPGLPHIIMYNVIQILLVHEHEHA